MALRLLTTPQTQDQRFAVALGVAECSLEIARDRLGQALQGRRAINRAALTGIVAFLDRSRRDVASIADGAEPGRDTGGQE